MKTHLGAVLLKKSKKVRECTLQHRSMIVLHEAVDREMTVKLGGTTLRTSLAWDVLFVYRRDEKDEDD